MACSEREKRIVALIVALQNIWNSALSLHQQILNSLVIHRTQRRRLINLLLADGVKSVRKSKKRKRSARKFWVKPGRSNTRWLAFQKNKVLPTDWFENFRMSKESFKILC